MHRIEAKRHVDALGFHGAIAALLAFGILLVGQFTPDPRLNVGGIPLNGVLFMVGAVWAFFLPSSSAVRVVAAGMLGLMAPLLLSAFWSLDPLDGFQKLGNLMVSSFLAAVLAGIAVSSIGLTATMRLWLLVLIALLAGAVVYKLLFGLLDRDVSFLILGPIVFARFMGVGAIIAACVLRGGARVLAVLAFSLAVLWTASKGPLIALLFVAVLGGMSGAGHRGRIWTVATILLTAVSLWFAADMLDDHPLFGRFFVALQIFDTGIDEVNWGSIGSRMELLAASAQQISTSPFGVGAGSWASSTGLVWAEYPHNFFMELVAEGGFLIGALALIPFLWFLVSRERVLFACCVFLAIGQQFSGDLLDGRIWLTLSTLALAMRFQQELQPGQVAGTEFRRNS